MANSLTYSKHASTRCGQRGIPEDVIDYLLIYGEAVVAGGGVVSYFLLREGLKEAEYELTEGLFQLLEKKKRAFVIVSNGGVIITAAWSAKKARASRRRAI